MCLQDLSIISVFVSWRIEIICETSTNLQKFFLWLQFLPVALKEGIDNSVILKDIVGLIDSTLIYHIYLLIHSCSRRNHEVLPPIEKTINF